MSARDTLTHTTTLAQGYDADSRHSHAAQQGGQEGKDHKSKHKDDPPTSLPCPRHWAQLQAQVRVSLSVSVCVRVSVSLCFLHPRNDTYTVSVYTHREREREAHVCMYRYIYMCVCVCVCVCVSLCVYVKHGGARERLPAIRPSSAAACHHLCCTRVALSEARASRWQRVHEGFA